ncbi:hypothetical protein BJ875DRAFT_55006 [Amylocarpus encephaloides]|uniref:RNase H type-1 domain-containing protein n=1 Tax=Amylocarpus encephaloides TaxID=45428 RepID=A0A9P8C4E8_9HELO|nr:hypothetical protein BJ875DRAFT_55006 [Amylocarpus encephaloides]
MMGCSCSTPESQEPLTPIPKRDRTFKVNDSSGGNRWEHVHTPQLGITRYMPFRDASKEEVQFNGRVGDGFEMGDGSMNVKNPRDEYLAIEISAIRTGNGSRNSPFLTTYGIFWGRNSSYNRNMTISKEFTQSPRNALLCALQTIMSLLLLEETQVATGKHVVIITSSEYIYHALTDHIYTWHDQSNYYSGEGQMILLARRFKRVHKAIHEAFTSKAIDVRFQLVDKSGSKGAKGLAQLAQRSPATFASPNELPMHPHLPWKHAHKFASLHATPNAEVIFKSNQIIGRLKMPLTRDNAFLDSYVSFLICGNLLGPYDQVGLIKYFNKRFGPDWRDTIKTKKDKLRDTLAKLKLGLDAMPVAERQNPGFVAIYERSAEIGRILLRIEKGKILRMKGCLAVGVVFS